MTGHLAYDIIQIVSRIDIMVSACCQQRADDSHVLCSLMVAAEEVVLPAQCNGTYLILGKVVVKQQSSILQISHHVVPSCIGIGDGLADQ